MIRPDPFDPEALRVEAVPSASSRLPRHRSREQFLKGPIPVRWLERAARPRGKSLALGLALWVEAGMKRSGIVTLSRAVRLRLGVGRNATTRSLRALEAASLVKVERHPGRAPRVTILAP